MIHCWISFYRDARGCGWKDDKILTTVEQILRDIAYPQADEVAARLTAYIQHFLLSTRRGSIPEPALVVGRVWLMKVSGR